MFMVFCLVLSFIDDVAHLTCMTLWWYFVSLIHLHYVLNHFFGQFIFFLNASVSIGL